jgi:AdoMet-dependent heme synthase
MIKPGYFQGIYFMRLNNFWQYRHIILSRRFSSSLWKTRQNVLCAIYDKPPVSGPHMAELDVTYRCNCRCQMCQRWRHSRDGEMTLQEYRNLAHIFQNMGVHLVSLAGGEPLLRDDIFSIIEAFQNRALSVNLCTNGILLEDYATELCSTNASCVTISLDGASARCHEAVRGAPGTFHKIESGIRTLLESPPESRPIVRVRMTISNRNLHEVRAFYNKWRGIADDVLLQPVHHCSDSYYTGLGQDHLALDSDRLDKQLKGTALGRDTYMRCFIKSLKESGAFPRYRCYAGMLMVRIDPWGNIYPCLEQHVRIGSLRDRDFRTIWNSDAFNRERLRIASDKMCNCWYNNTAMISTYGKLLYNTTVSGLMNTLRGRLKK